jgi:hypothetical protein
VINKPCRGFVGVTCAQMPDQLFVAMLLIHSLE